MTISLLAAAAFIHEAVYLSFPYHFTDFGVYYASARAAAHGLNPFERQAVAAELAHLQIKTGLNEYLYPAPFLVFLQPLLAFSLPVAHKIFISLSYLFLIGSVLLLWLSFKKAGYALPFCILTIISLMFTPIWSNLAINQANLVVLFLLCASLFFMVHGRDAAAGVSLGLAVMVKIMPALLFVYFLVRRQWHALLGGLAAVLSLEIVSWLYFGRLLDLYLPGALMSHSSRELHYWVNMAVPALLVRATGLPGTGVLKVCEFFLAAGIVAPTVYFLWKCRRAEGSERLLLFGLLITDFLILQTILFTHHLVVLLIPFMMVLLFLTQPQPDDAIGNRKMKLALLAISFILVDVDYWRVWTAVDMEDWGWWAHPGAWGLVMFWLLQVVILSKSGSEPVSMGSQFGRLTMPSQKLSTYFKTSSH